MITVINKYGQIKTVSSTSSSGVAVVSATSPITSSGGVSPDISTSMNTNKLIGRGSGGVGVMEEITLGTGLSLAGNTLNASSVTPAALSKTDDTNVTLTLGGTPLTALLQAVSLTLGWTGTLADARIASATAWNAKIDGSGTINELAYFTASDTIASLSTATYPSLTELSYVKGVTSAVQTQLDRKETFIYSKSNANLGTVTGTTAETVLLSVNISAGEYVIGDILTWIGYVKKTGVAGLATIRTRAGTAGTTADALIGTWGAMALGNPFCTSERRNMTFDTGNLLVGARDTTTLYSDVTASSQITSTSLNPANAWKLTITCQLAAGTDTIDLRTLKIGKIKTF